MDSDRSDNNMSLDSVQQSERCRELTLVISSVADSVRRRAVVGGRGAGGEEGVMIEWQAMILLTSQTFQSDLFIERNYGTFSIQTIVYNLE